MMAKQHWLCRGHSIPKTLEEAGGGYGCIPYALANIYAESVHAPHVHTYRSASAVLPQ